MAKILNLFACALLFRHACIGSAYRTKAFPIRPYGGTPVAIPLADDFTFLPTFFSSPTGPVTRVLVIVHGSNRNPGIYFEYALAGVLQANQGASTLVVAPWFNDHPGFQLGSRAIWNPVGLAATFYHTGDWCFGARAGVNQTGPTSYEAFDTIFYYVHEKYPSITEWIATGFSAGSQFGSRWSIFSPLGQEGKGPGGKGKLLAIWGASSTFCYLSDLRPNASCIVDENTGPALNCTLFGPPVKTCYKQFDHYPYGLQHLGSRRRRTATEEQSGLSAYLEKTYGLSGSISHLDIASKFANKNVIFSVGTRDQRSCSKGSCNDHCGSMMQGSNRLQRNLNYYKSLEETLSKPGAPYATKYSIFVGSHDPSIFFGTDYFNQQVFGPDASGFEIPPDAFLGYCFYLPGCFSYGMWPVIWFYGIFIFVCCISISYAIWQFLKSKALDDIESTDTDFEDDGSASGSE